MQHKRDASRRFLLAIIYAWMFDDRFETTMWRGNKKIASRIQKQCVSLRLEISFEMKTED